MERILLFAFIACIAIHGLIHLMGFLAYWPLSKITELPYKTTLLGGRWEIGASGTRIAGLVWMAAALGFLAAALALAFGRSFWAPVLLGAALLSLTICALDWKAAFRGAWIDAGLLLILFFVFGLRVRPAPFPAFAGTTAVIETIPLPVGLPRPVERFYRQTYGDSIPVYQTAVLSGRGPMTLMGIAFPSRMRFSHVLGVGYRHYFESTFSAYRC